MAKMENNGQAITLQPEQGEGGAGKKAHWSLRPWPLLLFFAIAGLIVDLLGYAIDIPVSRYILANSEYLAYHPYTVLPLDSAEWIYTIAAMLCLYFFVRHQQRKHTSESASCWKIGVAFWVGIALLAGYMALMAGRLLPPLQRVGGEYRSQMIASDIVMLITYFVVCITSGLSVLSVSLYFPVLERRFGIVRASLVSCAVFAGFGAVSTLIYGVVIYFTMPQAPIALSIWNSIMHYTLGSIIGSIATVPLCIAFFLIAGRRIPGAWALLASIMGFVNFLIRWLPSLLPSSINQRQLIIQIPLNIVIFLISLAILWGFQRWKTFGSFFVDFKAFLRKTYDD